jgi:hypothetical protein
VKAEHFSPDIQEFLLLLARKEVKYLIVFGEAVIYYGHARLTGDVDLFYERSPENALKLFQGLQEFWGGTIPEIARPEELLPEGRIVQLGVPPNRIDLMNSIDGVDFPSAWHSRVIENMVVRNQRIEIYFIGLKHLIQNKKVLGRHQDLADLEFLLKIEQP